jgi:phospholipase/carboxylesterase
MKLNRSTFVIFFLISGLLIGSCQSAAGAQIIQTVEPNALPKDVPTVPPTEEPIDSIELNLNPLPQRTGPQVVTSGTVPHVQIDVNIIPEVDAELYRLAFSLPDVENRPTVISLPGARGMWITEDVPLVNPEVIVSGREFAHIHPDGSLHLALPFERALEVAVTGWGERHPWADERENWEGFVMLYTPQSMDELTVTFQLILESYNYVTGRELIETDLGL